MHVVNLRVACQIKKAKMLKEDQELIDAEFKYVRQRGGTKVYSKPK
jgi:hypothetical protein